MKARLPLLTATMLFAGLISTIPTTASALGFGQVKVLSEIGQPLHAEVDVNLSANEYVTERMISVVPSSQYSKFDVPVSSAINGLSVEISKKGSSKAVAVVRTKDPVKSSNLEFMLKTDGPNGSMYRSFKAQLNTSALEGSSALDGSKKSRAYTVSDMVSEESVQYSPVVASSAHGDGFTIYSNVVELDKRPDVKLIKRVRANGNGQPLMGALRTVVPKDWKAFSGDGKMSQKQVVSYQGANRLWISVLDDVMTQSDMSATVDWHKREVTFRGLDSVVTKAHAKPQEESVKPSESRATDQVKAPKPVDPAPAVAVTVKPKTTQEAAPQAVPVSSPVTVVKAEAKVVPVVSSDTVPAASGKHVHHHEDSPRREAHRQHTNADGELFIYRGNAVVKKDGAAFDAKSRQEARNLARARALAAQSSATPESNAYVVRESVAKGNVAQANTPVASEKAHVATTTTIASTEVGNQPATASSAYVVKENVTPAVVETQKSAPVVSKAAKKEKSDVIEFFGKSQAVSHTVKTAGFNVNLLTAVPRIIPSDWSVFTRDQALMKVDNVTWRGNNRDWLIVLEEALSSVGAKAVVNVDDKEVIIMPR